MGIAALLRSARDSIRHMGELRSQSPSIVFLNRRWVHHGARSGYLLDRGIGPSVAREDRLIPHPLVRWRAARTADELWEQRLLTWANVTLAGADLLHLVDGDFDTWLQPRPRWARARLTATFHQPVDRLAELAPSLRPLDGIICMSRPQVPLLESLAPPGRCVVIPHGVDTEFFTPAAEAERRGPAVLLSVGAHRRDFPTLVAAARVIRARRADAVVRLVAPKQAAEKVRAEAGDSLEIFSGVSDEELRAQYRAAAALLLPLEAATANNAVLEAMACGIPTVTTDIADLRDYVTPDAAVFCPSGDAEAHAAAALALLDDEPRGARMGRAAREQAESLAWPKVRALAGEFFRKVIAGGAQ